MKNRFDKKILSLAILFSCGLISNAAGAQDVTTHNDFTNSIKNTSGDLSIKLLNNLENTNTWIESIKSTNLILNGAGYGINNETTLTRSPYYLTILDNNSVQIKNIGSVNNIGEVINSFNNYNFNSVFNNKGTLSIDNSVFYLNQNNSGDSLGGVIFNQGLSPKIIATFIENYAKRGGAIYNYSGTISQITSTFINNNAIYGGAIYNNPNVKINIVNSNFSNNSSSINGGAIYNLGNLTVTNSSFINNYTNAKTYSGGAIYSADLRLIADNGITKIAGNYYLDNSNNKISDGIYFHSADNTLQLSSINNGEIIIDDTINGIDSYNINIDGDNSSKVSLNGILYNSKTSLSNTNLSFSEGTFSSSSGKGNHLNVQSGTVKLANNTIENYSINKLTSSQNANWEIDIDTTGTNVIADKIITDNNSNYRYGSSGLIKIDDINFIGQEKNFTVQVLETSPNNANLGRVETELALSDDLKNKYNGTTTETLLTSDEMRADVNWKDTFKTYKQEKTTTSTLALDTINTTNDSITFSQTTTLGQVVESGTAGDTLALLNQYKTTETRNFNFDNATDVYTVQSDLGTTSGGTLNINGFSTETGRSTINGNSKTLFKLDNETDLNLNNVKIQNAASVVTGSNKDAKIVLNNVELKDNSSGIRTAGSVTIKGDSTLTNNGNGIEVTSNTSEITVDATDSEITLGDTLTGVRGARLNLNNGRVKVQKKISALDVMMNNAEVDMASDTLFNGQNITVNTESSLNMINNATSIMSVNTLTLKDTLNLAVDVDLANQSMDRIIASNYDLGSYVVNVNQMNLLTSTDRYKTDIPFADAGLKNSVTTSISEIAYSPIYKYNVAYSKDSGEFSFTRAGVTPVNPTPDNPNGSGGTTGGNSYDSYNPAVMASPVAAQLGGYMGMLDTYNNAFAHMDMYMLKPSTVRLAEQRQNQYAITETANVTYNGKPNEMNSKGVWVKPYASFDSVSLKDGPKADNFSYGSFIGGDSDMFKLKNGFYGVVSPYVAYQGSHQSYSGNSVYQNGGTVGVTGTFYKGNFFTGVTVGTGANISEASTMYGSEDFPMLMAGIANKTGYNFEFKDGRFIIQPNLQLSYTFVNTFDYTNGAGVRIESDPLHAIQVAPNVRFIMNTEGGWQPYATVGFRWNIMDETNFTAAESTLPEMSIKPYVNYGFGIQRTINDRLTAYGQIMLRHGGRNGIAANFGGRYMLGSESDPNSNKHEL